MTIEKIQELIQNNAQKKCKKCGEVKSVKEFFIKKCKENKYNRFNSPCKKCSNKDRAIGYMKNYQRQKKYGILPYQYEKMLESQSYKCAICGVHKDEYNKEFSVDHCHTTGKIRGLLCSSCNIGIGMFKDNAKNLGSAILYLKSNE